MKNTTPFRTALKNAMLETARVARCDGTTAMSIDCLKANVPPPSQYLDGAPRGTNCQYYYAEMFREIVSQSPQLLAFTRQCETVQCRD